MNDPGGHRCRDAIRVSLSMESGPLTVRSHGILIEPTSVDAAGDTLGLYFFPLAEVWQK